MIVLEEWRSDGWRNRLIVTARGHIKAQWLSRFHRPGQWLAWDDYAPFPLFGQKKTSRPTARAKSRPRTRRT